MGCGGVGGGIRHVGLTFNLIFVKVGTKIGTDKCKLEPIPCKYSVKPTDPDPVIYTPYKL